MLAMLGSIASQGDLFNDIYVLMINNLTNPLSKVDSKLGSVIKNINTNTSGTEYATGLGGVFEDGYVANLFPNNKVYDEELNLVYTLNRLVGSDKEYVYSYTQVSGNNKLIKHDRKTGQILNEISVPSSSPPTHVIGVKLSQNGNTFMVLNKWTDEYENQYSNVALYSLSGNNGVLKFSENVRKTSNTHTQLISKDGLYSYFEFSGGGIVKKDIRSAGYLYTFIPQSGTIRSISGNNDYMVCVIDNNVYSFNAITGVLIKKSLKNENAIIQIYIDKDNNIYSMSTNKLRKTDINFNVEYEVTFTAPYHSYILGYNPNGVN